MRHVINITGLIILSFILSIGQHFITGIYGKQAFPFILGCVLFGYWDYQNMAKVFRKTTDK
jgi:hypothetical protein